MKKIVLTFGLISSAILLVQMFVLMPLCLEGTIRTEYQTALGYTAMFLAFLLVFLGIRSYRDNINGGTITFGRAFKVGFLIAMFAVVTYVVSWEIYFYTIGGDFMTKYTAHVLSEMRTDGATEAAIAAKAAELATMAKWYDNPLVNIGMTILEILPPALVMTLIAAAILRRKNPPTRTAAAVAA